MCLTFWEWWFQVGIFSLQRIQFFRVRLETSQMVPGVEMHIYHWVVSNILFTLIFGEMIQFDDHIFQMGGSTTNQSRISVHRQQISSRVFMFFLETTFWLRYLLFWQDSWKTDFSHQQLFQEPLLLKFVNHCLLGDDCINNSQSWNWWLCIIRAWKLIR